LSTPGATSCLWSIEELTEKVMATAEQAETDRRRWRNLAGFLFALEATGDRPKLPFRRTPMDDEAKQLLREIRDRLAKSDARRMVVYCILVVLMFTIAACALVRVGQERERDRRDAARSWPRAVGG
jgi:hypothetical protein